MNRHRYLLFPPIHGNQNQSDFNYSIKQMKLTVLYNNQSHKEAPERITRFHHLVTLPNAIISNSTPSLSRNISFSFDWYAGKTSLTFKQEYSL